MVDDDVKRSVNQGLKTLCLALGKIDDGEIEGDFGLGDSLESELDISSSSEEYEELKRPTEKNKQRQLSSIEQLNPDSLPNQSEMP